MKNLPTIFGFVYGLMLSCFAFISGGLGEGTFLPLALFSSPLIIFGGLVALFGTPFLWAVLGFFLAKMRQKHRTKRFAFFVLCIHYIPMLIFIFIFIICDLSDIILVWEQLPFFLIGGFATYLIGQVLIWLFIFKYLKK